MGGIHPAAGLHILLCEASKTMTKTERVEVLVHELDTFLGLVTARIMGVKCDLSWEMDKPDDVDVD